MMTNKKQNNSKLTPSEAKERAHRRARFREEVSQAVYTLMRTTGTKRSDLAIKLDCSRPFVSKILNGSHNFSLNTIVDVFCALGRAPHLTLGIDLSELRYAVDEAAPVQQSLSQISRFTARTVNESMTPTATAFVGTAPVVPIMAGRFHDLLMAHPAYPATTNAEVLATQVQTSNKNYSLAA